MAHAVSSRNEQVQAGVRRRRWWSGWPHWTPYAAAAWSLAYYLRRRGTCGYCARG
ncbi:hypothetical protein ACFV4Q_26575 [Streptomyces nojiriensis]|uniref:hypothetical protein n=1 Tax=Streptomyces nojiriensis TaxID=66374 RepID=UPI0036625B9C